MVEYFTGSHESSTSAQARIERHGNGRYQLQEAANAIAANVVNGTFEARAKELLAALIDAARADTLPTYEPGKTALYRHADGARHEVRSFYEEAYWNDLNQWIEKNEQRVDFRFGNPAATPGIDALLGVDDGLSRLRWLDDRIRLGDAGDIVLKVPNRLVTVRELAQLNAYAQALKESGYRAGADEPGDEVAGVDFFGVFADSLEGWTIALQEAARANELAILRPGSAARQTQLSGEQFQRSEIELKELTEWSRVKNRGIRIELENSAVVSTAAISEQSSGNVAQTEYLSLAKSDTNSAPADEAASELQQPRGIYTRSVAAAFDGLKWSEAKWMKPLGDKPKWLERCVLRPAKRGKEQTHWNPICIGSAIISSGSSSAKSVRARFQTNLALTPFLDEWKDYEAQWHSTD